jgi:Protein of unknown function (DUF742)
MTNISSENQSYPDGAFHAQHAGQHDQAPAETADHAIHANHANHANHALRAEDQVSSDGFVQGPMASKALEQPPADYETAMVRSFLGRSLRSGPETEFDDRTFRPFLVTGGRTTSEFPLDFEAMVTPTPAGLSADLRFEQRTMLDRCIQSGAQSIAELAAYLKLPIGSIRVVAADLVSSHLLDVHSPNKNLSNDVLMLKRLINGVRAL